MRSPCRNCPDLNVYTIGRRIERECQNNCEKLKEYQSYLDYYDAHTPSFQAVDCSGEEYLFYIEPSNN